MHSECKAFASVGLQVKLRKCIKLMSLLIYALNMHWVVQTTNYYPVGFAPDVFRMLAFYILWPESEILKMFKITDFA